jgi:hypothetical protein
MEPLSNPHWQVMPGSARHVLQNLASAVELAPFYLAGGTALALRLGHRISIDLDFFGDLELFEREQRELLIRDFGRRFNTRVARNSALALTIVADGVAASFYTYTYPLLDELEQVNGVPIAGIRDIGLMKLDSMMDRGARKDFIDLYFITKHVSLDQLFQDSAIKYRGSSYFKTQVLEALVDFDNADGQEQPEMLIPVSWDEVKQFCIDEAIRFGKNGFEDK